MGPPSWLHCRSRPTSEVAVVVAEGKVPGWGQQTRHDDRDAQIRAANQFDRNRQLAIDREARAQAASDERNRHARVLARDSNYFNRDWLRLAPAEPQSQHAQGQQTPSNPRTRKNQSSRNQSGGKRKHQNNDSSDDERDSIWSQSASEKVYSSNQPSSSHRKKERKQKPPRFEAHRAQLTQEANTRRESLYAAWAAADEHQSDKPGKDVRPRQYPNFSNTPPPTFTPS